MNIALSPDLEFLVSQKVHSGLYVSPLEVIRTALQLLDQRDAEQQAILEELRAKIEAGLAQLERGENIPSEQIFDELRRKSQLRRQEMAQV